MSSSLKVNAWRIISFEKKVWPLRIEFWKTQGILKEENLEVVPAEDFAHAWPALQKSTSCLLIDEKDAAQVLAQFASLPSEIRQLQACDSIVNVNGQWWVRNYWALALKESLVKRVSRLDTHSVAYLTGQSGYARASLAVLAQMGFKKINWITDEPESLIPEKEVFLRKFFGVELVLLDSADLTLQPNNGTILINTLVPDAESSLLQDLIYLNFLQKGGAAVSTELEPLEDQLLLEAESVGVHSVPGWYLEGARDQLLLSQLRVQGWPVLVPEVDLYLKEWREFLKTRLTSSQN